MAAHHRQAEFRQQIYAQPLVFHLRTQVGLAMTDQSQGQLENVGGRRRAVWPHPAAVMP
jgi:hypothetical protein